jgi:adenylylsulfate kinase-like enzyme
MFFFIEVGKYAISIWLGYLSGSKKSVYRNILEQSFMEKGDKYY